MDIAINSTLEDSKKIEDQISAMLTALANNGSIVSKSKNYKNCILIVYKKMFNNSLIVLYRMKQIYSHFQHPQGQKNL